MKIQSHTETVWNAKHNTTQVIRVYTAHYHDFFSYGKTAREAIARIFFSIELSNNK